MATRNILIVSVTFFFSLKHFYYRCTFLSN